MSHQLHRSPSPSASKRTGRAVRTWLFCLAAGATLVSGARADGPLPCGVSLAPEDVLRALNETRARGKVCHAAGERAVGAPLRWSERLAEAAMTQSREMAILRRMSHRDSLNRNLGERLRDQGYRFTAAAENVAVGYPSLDDVVAAWLDSEGHCENLMSAAVLELGLACIDGSEAGAREEHRYWTLVLGAPPPGR